MTQEREIITEKVFEGVHYLSLTEAAKGTPYSQEYLSLLARRGKISARKIGRNWFITRKAITQYLKSHGNDVVTAVPDVRLAAQLARVDEPVVEPRPVIVPVSMPLPTPPVMFAAPVVASLEKPSRRRLFAYAFIVLMLLVTGVATRRGGVTFNYIRVALDTPVDVQQTPVSSVTPAPIVIPPTAPTQVIVSAPSRLQLQQAVRDFFAQGLSPELASQLQGPTGVPGPVGPQGIPGTGGGGPGTYFGAPYISTNNLTVSGPTTLASLTATDASFSSLTVGGFSSLTTASVSANFEVAGTASAAATFGSGLTACTNTTDKLLWDSVTGQFSCGVDQTGGGGGSLVLKEGSGGSFTTTSSVQFSASGFNISFSGASASISLDYINGPASRAMANTWTALNVFSAGASVSGSLEIAGTASVSSLTIGGTAFNPSSYYLASNPAGYITDGNTNWDNTYGFATYASFSAVSPLAYNNATGAFSVAVNYDIPLTASVSAWESFRDTPSTRIIAGSNLSWSTNTLNVSSTPLFTSVSVSQNFEVGGVASVSQLFIGGALFSGRDITSNSLDFDEFANAMNLDANTTIASHGFSLNFGNTTLTTGTILPDMTGAIGTLSFQTIGDSSHWYSDLYVESIHMGGNSLYVNGQKVLHVAGSVMNFEADTDQTLRLSTSGTANLVMRSTGTGNLQLVSDQTVLASASGGITLNVPTGLLGSNINIANSSLGGDILLNASGAGSNVFLSAVSGVSITSPMTSTTGNFEAAGFASSSQLFGSGLSACTGTNKLIWNNGFFSCATDIGSAGSSIQVSEQGGALQNTSSLSFASAHFNVSYASPESLVKLDWINGPASRAMANTWTALNVFSAGASVSTNLEVSGIASASQLFIGGTAFRPVTSDSLDFDEFVDAMTLDANLSVASAGFSTTWNGNTYFMQGNVGIGTTSPNRRLDVVGNIEAHGYIYSTGGIGRLVLNANSQNWYVDNFGATGTPINRFRISEDTGERLTILSGGNVGIGTTNVDAKLEVAGTASISGATTLAGVTYTWPATQAVAGAFLQNDGAGSLAWTAIRAATSDSLDFDEFVDAMTLDANLSVASAGFSTTWNGNTYFMQGNVGIGTTNPTIGALQVTGGSAFTTIPTNTSAIGIINSTTGWYGSGFLFSVNANDAFSLVYNGAAAYFGGVTNVAQTPWYVVSATGLSVGTAVPVNKLDVAGGAAIGSYAATNTAPTNGIIVSGNVGIGTANVTSKLEVAGTASISGLVTLTGGITSRGAGTGSEVFGNGATAAGATSMAIGANSTAATLNSMAVGNGATAQTGTGAMAVGLSAYATGASAMAIGPSTIAAGNSAVALGAGAIAPSLASVMIGAGASGSAGGISQIGIGANTYTRGTRVIAIGNGAQTRGSDSIAIGNSVHADGNQIVMGDAVVATTNLFFNLSSSSAPAAFTINGTAGAGTDVAGANLSVAAGRGTGTGVGGSLLFRTAPAGTTGTSQNALVTRLTIDSTGLAIFANNVSISGNIELTGTVTSNLTPTTNNVYSLGTSALRWSNLFAAYASVSMFEAATASVSQLFVSGTALRPVTSDSLDFDELVDAMTLDANLTIASAGFSTTWNGDTYFMDGNVGIGTNSPAYKLDVVSPSGWINRFSDGTRDVRFYMATGAAMLGSVRVGDDWKFFVDGTSARGMSIKTGTGNIVFGDNNGGAVLESGYKLDIRGSQPAANGFLAISSISTGDVLVVDNSGNVGIGTSNPLARLDVSGGNVYIRSPQVLYSDNINSYSGDSLSISGGTTLRVILYPDTTFKTVDGLNNTILTVAETGNLFAVASMSQTLFTVSELGNVGIGTVAPAAALDIVGSIRSTALVTSGSLPFVGGANGSLREDPNVFVGLNADGSRMLTLKATAAQPYPSFTFEGPTGTVESGFQRGGTGIVSFTANTEIDFNQNGGTRRMTINAGGIGIGTMTPTATLAIAGTASISGKLSLWNSASISANLEVAGYASASATFGSGLSACTGKLLWSDGLFSCGVDQTGTGGIASIAVREGSGAFSHITSISFNAGAFNISNLASESLVSLDYTNGPASRAMSNTWTALNVFSAGASVSGSFEVAGTASISGTTLLAVASGNVGIGVASPSAKLDVAGDVLITNSSLGTIITTGGTNNKGLIVRGSPADQLFTATDLTGLQLWLKADALALADNDAVATWTDSSTFGTDATQASAPLQPTYKTNILNGKPVVRFNGSNRMTGSSSIVQPVTTCAVVTKAVTGNRYIFDGGSNQNIVYSADDTHYGTYSGVVLSVAVSNNLNVPTVVCAVDNGASSVISANGTSQSGNTGTGAGSGTYTVGDYGGATQKWNGDIAEIITYDHALSLGERQQIEGYLAWKYGLEGSLPSDHPYKSAAPTVGGQIANLQEWQDINTILSVVNPSGNFGIGTTTPSEKLEVAGAASISGNLILGGTVSSNLTPTTDNAYSLGTSALRWSSLFAVNASISSFEVSGIASVSALTVNGGTIGAYWSRSGSNTYLANTGDNVGIGATTPEQELEVAGNIFASASGNVDIILRSSTATADHGKFVLRSAGASDRFEIMGGATPTSFVTVASTGFVGIGTTAPSEKLVVQSGNAVVSNTAYVPGLTLTGLNANPVGLYIDGQYYNSTYGPGVFWRTPNDNTNVRAGIWGMSYISGSTGKEALLFGASGDKSIGLTSTVMIISAPEPATVAGGETNGYVGIGTTAPTAALTVQGFRPVSVAGTGTTGQATLNITGGQGGNSTGATTAIGGIGGTLTMTSGLGGVASAALTTSTGGAGGVVTITGGAGGTGGATSGGTTGVGGAGGAFAWTAGTGGASTNTVSGANTGGAGGAIAIRAGAGGAASNGLTNVGGSGGSFTIQAGNAGIGTGVGNINNGDGGQLLLLGGASAAASASDGGAVQLIGAAGSTTGNGGVGGALTLTAGAAGGDNTVARQGGNVGITAGVSKGFNVGGTITLTAGAAGQNVTAAAAQNGPTGGGIAFSLGAGGFATNSTTTSAGGAGGGFVITGAAGGNTGISGITSNTGGAGSAFTWSSGAGGRANGATSGANVGGASGGVTFSLATGGYASGGTTTNTGGNGGTLTMNLGVGGIASGQGAANNVGGNGGAYTIQLGTGGVATNGSGANTGGTGAVFTWTAGTGGAANAGIGTPTNVSGGTGGGITIQAGTGGAGSGGSGITKGGAGGAMVLQAGTAGVWTGTGDSATTGAGGLLTLRGGLAAAASSSAGGGITLTGAVGSNTGSGGVGGAINIGAGAAGGDNTVARAGGLVAITAGLSKGNVAGGAMSFTAGAAGQYLNTGTTTAPNGGAIGFLTGAGGTAPNADVLSTGGAGGGFTITTGAGGAAAVAGTGNNTGGAGGGFTVGTALGGAATGVTTGTNTGGNSGGIQFTTGSGAAASGGANNTGGTAGTLFLANHGGSSGNGGAASGAATGTNKGGNGAAVLANMGKGGAASGGNINTGGNAGSFSVTYPGGGGGAATGAGTTNTGGTGGAITITAAGGGSASGATTNLGGAGGTVSITAGTAGAWTGTGLGTGTGAGGALTLSAGAAAPASGSAGGAVTINAGAGSTTGNGGLGGAIVVTAGAAGGDHTQNRQGGAITLTAGLSKGNVAGGAFSVTTGAAGTNLTVASSVTGPNGGAMNYTLGAGGGATLASTTAIGGNGGAYTITGGAGAAIAVSSITNNTGGVGSAFSWTSGNGGAASGTTSGTNTGGASGGVTFSLGTGGAASNATTANTGGAGGAYTLTAGTGGAATTASTLNTGAVGGAITIRAGAGGAASGGTSNVGGAGGAFIVAAGNAGVGTGIGNFNNGDGGLLTLSGGAAATSSASDGGGVTILGTAGSATGSGGVGGTLTLTAGAGGASTKTARVGGSILLTTGVGGVVSSASATTTGANAGAFTVTLGAGGAVSATGTTAAGGNAGVFSIVGGVGGAAGVAGVGVTNIGGTGSSLSFTAGNGGVMPNGPTGTVVAGAGGGIRFRTGDASVLNVPTAALTTGADGGDFVVITGNGSNPNNANKTGGNGGSISLRAGNAGAGSTSSGVGGSISLLAGTGYVSAVTGITSGGAVSILGGDACILACGNGSGVANNGGGITIRGGGGSQNANGIGTGTGGHVTIQGGLGASNAGSGIGGTLTLAGGDTGSGGALANPGVKGGDVIIQGGLSTFSTAPGGEIIFKTSSANPNPLAERMRITPSGNVGIGTANIDAMLEVAGTASIGGNTTIGGFLGVGTTTLAARLNVQAGASDIPVIIASSSGMPLFKMDALGNTNFYGNQTNPVGIATSGIRVYSFNSTAQTVLALTSSRSDATAVGIGGYEVDMLSNDPGHKRLTSINTQAEGSTANQRGGALIFYTKPDASTTLTIRGAISQTGSVSFNLPTIGSAAVCWQPNSQFGTALMTLTDCASGPSADYMELYPMTTEVQEGEIVVPSSTSFVLDNENNKVARLIRSTRPYQSGILGITSIASQAGDFNSIGYNIDQAHNPKPLALSGRVLLKVSTQNGPIKVGDRITSSDIPGVGMKATVPGMTVGTALEALPFTSGPYQKIMVFVQAQYWAPELTADQPIATSSWQSSTFDSLFASITAAFKSLLNITFQNGLIQTVKGMFTEVQTDRLCIGSTCLTEQELQQILQAQGIIPGSTPVPTPSPTPSVDVTPTASTSPAPTPTDGGLLTPTPTPTEPLVSGTPTPSPLVEATPTPSDAPAPTVEAPAPTPDAPAPTVAVPAPEVTP